MIKSIRIQNFRSCKDVTLKNIPNVLVLVGRNGAGKTNVLRAIHWLARTSTRSDEHWFPSIFGYETVDYTVEIEVILNNCTYYYKLHRSQGPVPYEVDRYRIEFNLAESLSIRDAQGTRSILERTGQVLTSILRPEPMTLNQSAGSLLSIMAVLPSTDPLANAVRPLYEFLSAVRYYPIDEPCDPQLGPDFGPWVQEKAYQDWSAKYVETKNPGDSVQLRILHMWLTSDEKFGRLIYLLGPDGLDLIGDIECSKFPPETGAGPPLLAVMYLLVFKPIHHSIDGPKGFNYSDLSTGTRRTLKIIVSLLFDSSAVMLLEHPEDGIHAGLLKSLIDIMKDNIGNRQIIMTSHSQTLLNELDPDQVRFVTMDESQTHVRALKPNEKKAARQYMSEKGTFAEFVELVEANEAAK